MESQKSKAKDAIAELQRQEFDLNLKEKDVSIAAANEEAKKAGKSAGEANRRAEEIARENITLKGQFETATAEANRKAQELKEQNLATEGRLTEASIKLEQERIKRAELELTLAPRIIPFRTYVDGTENIDSLKPQAGTEVILEYIQDAEAGRAAANIKWLIERSGWKVVSAGVTSKPTFDGITILSFVAHGPEQANFQFRSLDIAQALDEFLFDNNWQSGVGFDDTLKPNQLKILVGFKPSPYFQNPKEREIRRTAHEIRRLTPDSNPKKHVVEEMWPPGLPPPVVP